MSFSEDDGFDGVDFPYAVNVYDPDSEWITKDGTPIKLKDMGDTHLLNAYKKSGSGFIEKEMIIRMFNAYIKQKEVK